MTTPQAPTATGSAYYRLFEHMIRTHDLTLTDSELADICDVVEAMKQNVKGEPMTATKRHPKMPTCSACGVAWTDHLGIAGTCRKLENARGALKVIYTWASFRDGELLTAKDAKNLCMKALKETAPNGRMRDGGQR
jgi:hypothetical protein